MHYAYEALTADGRSVQDRLEASSEREAADSLRGRGMMVLRLRPSAPAAEPRVSGRGGVSGTDLVLFTRQMRMLLESGAAVVPALEAIEAQSRRGGMRAAVHAVRTHVETGGSLSEALGRHSRAFGPLFVSMVAAGELTASLPEAFARLNELLQRQLRVRRSLVGAMIYPLLLCVMCAASVATLMLFVVPRFKQLFEGLRAPVPMYTQALFWLSAFCREQWAVLGLGAVGLIGLAALVLRAPGLRLWLDAVLPGLPLIGRMYARLTLARVLRVWAAGLRCHVPLLEILRQSRGAVRSALVLRSLDEIEERVAAGGRMGRVLSEHRWVEPVVAAAITTGEDNGKLADAVDFVSKWLDEDNDQMISDATRIVEPAMLAFMGLIVGAVAMALFLPLFDIATAGR
ncbi:MAG: type II secretion system F family protein [Phycisphaerae bacterium]|jgi:type II secretory pathway component PulF